MLAAWPIVILATITGTQSLAAPVALRSERFHGRQAWVLDNGTIRITALRGGGHLAEIRFVGDASRSTVNPMYVPPYPTIEPHEFDPGKHGAAYGTGPGRWLSAGYMGHLLCFPSFGPPSSPAEVSSGLGFHGEAVMVEWKQHRKPRINEQGATLYYGADLPRTQFRVERAIHLPANETVVHVEEWIENLASWDRPYNREQHATFGAPFVAPGKTLLDLSGTRGITDRRTAGGWLPANREFTWPDAQSAEGIPISLRAFHDRPGSTTYLPVLLDAGRETGFFTLSNADHRLVIGYLFPTADNPWIVDWQNFPRPSPPGDRRARGGIARGIEFGTSPYDEGLRKSVERGSMFGVPAYAWIPGKQKIKTSFTIFLADVPEQWTGVRNVRQSQGAIELEEWQGGRRASITCRH